MTARGEATTAELQDAVWAELLACYGEGQDTDWPYLKDLTDLIVEMIGRHSASERARAQRLQEALTKIAGMPCGIPGHVVAVGCCAANVARTALKGSSDA